jgi:hypothetical protein
MQASPDLSLNPRADIATRALGRERQPLIIIDGALTAPDALRDLACQAPFAPPETTLYPGLNAPAPRAYTENLLRALRPILNGAFGIPAHAPLHGSSFFALATGEPGALKPEQKVPHHDSNDPFMIALVHYLCHDAPAAPQGGTAFFRHRATGYEYVDDKRYPAYLTRMQAELAASEPAVHAGPETPGYEQIGTVDCVYNRLVMYRSISLHSGRLGISTLTSDPRTGRLTLNTLITVSRPAPRPG